MLMHFETDKNLKSKQRWTPQNQQKTQKKTQTKPFSVLTFAF